MQNTAHLPLVSIYIPTHNRASKLKRALASLLNQTYKNLEILVCDDGSSDETQEYVNELLKINKNIIYYRNERPMGACRARNICIESAKGEFITGLDDDDEFTPDRIQLFVDHWDDKHCFLCTDFFDFYPNKKAIPHYAARDTLEISLKELLQTNVASNQVFTKTRYFQQIGGFNTNVKRLQDWDTWIRLCSHHGAGLRLPFLTYIMHHDHLPNDPRVSKAIPLDAALEELFDRNRELYDDYSSWLIQSRIRYLRGKYTLKDASKSFKDSPSLKPLARFALQKFIKDRNK